MGNPVVIVGQQGQHYEQHRPEEVPARVRIAMEFLGFTYAKTVSRIGVNAMAMEEFKGLPLECEEERTREAACNLLTNYLSGKLKSTESEKQSLKRNKTMGGTHGTCPACTGADMLRRTCKLCRGAGEVVIYPAFDINT
jgi:hypothetical protein